MMVTVKERVRERDCVDGWFVQRSDVKSVKCGESIPQLGCETAKLGVVHILKWQNSNSNLNGSMSVGRFQLHEHSATISYIPVRRTAL